MHGELLGIRSRRLGMAFAAVAALVVLVISAVPVVASPASRETSPSVAGLSLSTESSPSSALQAAVEAAPAGGTVHLGPGLFVGQFVIDKDLTLVGAGEGRTILQSPRQMRVDSLGNVFEIEIAHGASVRLSGFSVRVTEQCMLANSIGVATGGGIGVAGNSSLRIHEVRLVAWGAAPKLNQPCTTHGSPGMYSFGRAISIGLDDPPGVGTAHQVEGHGWVRHVETRGFDIFSISVGGVRGPSGSTAVIRDNVVRVGPGPYTAAYGIVAYGTSMIRDNRVIGEAGSDGGIAVVFTSATVVGNTITNFTCASAPFPISPPCGIDPLYDDQDLGIFLAGITPGTRVSGNTVERSDVGILVEGPGAPAVIVHNQFLRNTYYGLDLIDANQTFRGDRVTGGSYAVAVAAGSGNSTAVLRHDILQGYSVALALLEANYPWVAKVIVRPA